MYIFLVLPRHFKGYATYIFNHELCFYLISGKRRKYEKEEKTKVDLVLGKKLLLIDYAILIILC